MKKFLDEDFLLDNKTARRLYHEIAENLPIIDYHCHLPPDEIASDRKFENLTQIWLAGDHYKWRAMRANGVDERFCTGDASDEEKFLKWAETVPDTLRNPLYHWTHLELKRYFNIDRLLNPKSAKEIYEEANSMLQTDEYSVRNLLKKMHVEVLCTTDDPVDTLEFHKQIQKDGFEIKVLPAWRPDRAMAVEDPATFNNYLDKLGKIADTRISSFMDLLNALQVRHDFFHTMGCRLSDHGMETFYSEEFSHHDIDKIFNRIKSGKILKQDEILKFKSAMLWELAIMDHEKGWTQQFHVGAIRNNNSKQYKLLGSDKGFDSIGDFKMAGAMSKFLDKLDSTDQLAKTILYNLNPGDNELMVTMAYNFNDGKIRGKMQFGSGWWFLDQKFGMINQMNALSSLGLLSRFVGMLTDSRSFMSYPRHEYFRRILCNLVGTDVENGEIPDDPDMINPLIENVCYRNAVNYFKF
ncbi:MAG TPA: glucuronate isomerase [Bacteroidaceae bacterium]|nr:glucuronate isomerase [Bacteroidaceae bacterium]